MADFLPSGVFTVLRLSLELVRRGRGASARHLGVLVLSGFGPGPESGDASSTQCQQTGDEGSTKGLCGKPVAADFRLWIRLKSVMR